MTMNFSRHIPRLGAADVTGTARKHEVLPALYAKGLAQAEYDAQPLGPPDLGTDGIIRGLV